jgi:hypothetical protein
MQQIEHRSNRHIQRLKDLVDKRVLEELVAQCSRRILGWLSIGQGPYRHGRDSSYQERQDLWDVHNKDDLGRIHQQSSYRGFFVQGSFVHIHKLVMVKKMGLRSMYLINMHIRVEGHRMEEQLFHIAYPY